MAKLFVRTQWRACRWEPIMEKKVNSKVILKISRSVLRACLNIIFYTVVVMLLIQVSKDAYEFAYQVFGSKAKDSKPGYEVIIQLQEDETPMNVATKLETNQIILNKYSFYFKMKLKDYKIMSGTYVLNTSMDYDEILVVITDSKNSIADKTILED